MSFQAEAKKFAGKDAVLVAVDFSADSEAALTWACLYAKCMKVPLIVFHAVHEPAESPGFYQRDEQNQLTPLTEVAAGMMEAFLEKTAENHPECPDIDKVNTVLVQGLPVERILEASEQLEASLVVMGSQGRTGLPSLLVGSIAEKVVEQSRIPVTIVKAPKDNGAEE